VAADFIFTGGAFTAATFIAKALGTTGVLVVAGHEVLKKGGWDEKSRRNFKEKIRWDPAILEELDDAKEEEIENAYMDFFLDALQNNPHQDIPAIETINDFYRRTSKRVDLNPTGEKVYALPPHTVRTMKASEKARGIDSRQASKWLAKQFTTSETALRQVIHGILNEVEDNDAPTSEEGQLAMLALHDDEAYRNMGLDLFRSSEHLDLDLLATELDNRLLAEWDKMPEEPQMPPTPAEWKAYGEYRKLYWDPWSLKIKNAVRFISGDYINRSFRPPDRVYRSGSIQDTIARALRQTATAWRKKK
jgi:hypothetical protein